MKRTIQLALILLFAITVEADVFAQNPTQHPPQAQRATPTATTYNNGLGFDILMTNSGFAFGGYYQKSLSTQNSFIFESYIGSVKDSREQKFFNYFGGSFIPNKQNYLLTLQTQFGIQRRLFQENIQDNFRPFVQVSGGPMLGWVSPYYNDRNGDLIRQQDENSYDIFSATGRGSATFGVDGFIGIGANFGVNKKIQQGLKIGYSMMYFFDEIRLMDIAVQDQPRSFYGTPTIALTFGRIR